jgi:HJR/Mrr/RecB family endonuclease
MNNTTTTTAAAPKYWLHRVLYEWDASGPLLEKNLLSTGWGRIIDEGLDVISVARNDGYAAYKMFMKEHCPEDGRPHMLFDFIATMSKGDIVVVPLHDGKFSVYKVTGPAREIESDERAGKDGKAVDLGFVLPVEPVVCDIERAKYADNMLGRYLKNYCTNVNLEKIKESVNEAIHRALNSKPLLFSEVAAKLAETLRSEMSKAVTGSRRFEQLIAWYFEKNGATTRLPSANAPDKGQGDADVIARFKLLGNYGFETVFYIQAKYHDKGTLTDEEAVMQISDYLTDHTENPDCAYKAIVISAADDFTETAKELATKSDVALINGREFAEMLIDAGIDGIDGAFE